MDSCTAHVSCVYTDAALPMLRVFLLASMSDAASLMNMQCDPPHSPVDSVALPGVHLP